MNKLNEKSPGVHDLIPRGLKYIALYEKRPMDSVKLRDCYMALSHVCNEMYFPKLDETTKYFLFEHLSTLAHQMAEAECETQRILIRDIKVEELSKKTVKTYNRKRKQVNAVLNPLNLPDSA